VFLIDKSKQELIFKTVSDPIEVLVYDFSKKKSPSITAEAFL